MTLRTFIALKINPTEKFLRRIYYLKTNLADENINWIKEDHFHITLKFIGGTPVDHIEQIANIVEQETSDLFSFDLTVSGISLFGSKYSPRVIWAGVEPENELRKMSDRIDQGLIRLGFETGRQNFVPHITLARIRKLRNKSHFNNVVDKLDNEIIQTETIESIIFYESVLKKSGAQYNVLKEIKLKS